MKKSKLQIREQIEPRKIQRADIPPTTGFTLVVDGHFKTEFADATSAKEGAIQLLAKNSKLKVEIYDSSSKSRTLIESIPPTLHQRESR
jgi:hypothetical protein